MKYLWNGIPLYSRKNYSCKWEGMTCYSGLPSLRLFTIKIIVLIVKAQ